MLLNRRFHFPSCNSFLAHANAIPQEVFPHQFVHTSGHSGGQEKYPCYINFLWQKNNYFSLLLCPSLKKNKTKPKPTNKKPPHYLPIHFVHSSLYTHFWHKHTKLTDNNKLLKTQACMNTGANLGPKG